MALCLLSRRTLRTGFAESLFAIQDLILGEAAWTVGLNFFTVPTPVLLRNRGSDQRQSPARHFERLSAGQSKSA